MITINSNRLSFVKAGLFTTNQDWIHPKAIVDTYEIIYVVDGTVNIEENGEKYCIEKGGIIILKPNTVHQGYKKSFGLTSFYWIHFHIDDISYFVKNSYCHTFVTKSSQFRELLHHSHTHNNDVCITDIILARILAEFTLAESYQTSSKLAKEIFEWVRINADHRLTVSLVAKHFQYNEEHISRLIQKEYGRGLKALIDELILSHAKDLILNTNYPIKEISNILHFDNLNSFIKFYKYHEKTTPSKYRNSYYMTLMNKE